MATAIRDVELSTPLSPVEHLEGSARCLLFLRWRGRIVGQAVADVSGGLVEVAALRAAVSAALGPAAVRAWVEATIGFDERAAPAAPRPAATVAICTRERPDDLRRTLAAVLRQQPRPHDVLVVDNAPATPRTREVVAAFPGVRYDVEPDRGLNRARNRALRHARGEVVAFTDDDAAPEPGWLAGLLANFGDSRVLVVTGLTLPLELETPAQELFEAYAPFSRGFERRVFDGHVDNPVAVSRAGAGANMAVRRSLVERVGPFDVRLDAGTPTRSGGDHELFARVLLGGWRIVYEPLAVSRHRHRRSDEELRHTIRGYGTGVTAMWTGLLLERRELAVLRQAWSWFRADHLPLLMRPSRLLHGRGPDGLRREELLGCLAGPGAWLASHRRSVGR